MKHRANEEKQVTDIETATILETLQSVLKNDVKGDIVEFGCYRGDTSVELQRVLSADRSSDKKLWLYDSFAGLPDKSAEDSSAAGAQFKKGELLVTKREVVEKFKKRGLKVPKIRKAFFCDLNPETDLPESIALAFLDGDLYQSIKDSLKLVIPKLSKDAIIIVHDYNNPELPGVTKAVDEFRRAHSCKMSNRETLAILKI